MADLIGTATIRVDMPTVAAARSIRQFATRADGQLRTLQSRISAVSRELHRVGDRTIGVTVDDRTAAGAASVRATIRDLQRLGPVQINARLDTEVTDIAATASALRGLQDAARGAARALGTLATRATTATAALTALGAAARSLRGDMDDLDGSVRRTSSGMTGLRGRLGTVTTSAGSAGGALDDLKKVALLLSPALIPIAAQAAPIAVALTAAGAAVGAFAAAAGGQVAALAEASDAEKKYQDAVDEHGARSAEAIKAQADFQRQIAKMPPATRTAAAALSTLKDQYRQWSDSLAGDTMPVATKSFALFGALFPKLTPVVQGASTQLNRFVTIAAGGVQSGAFDAFMKRFAEFSTGALSKANDALIRFTRTLDTGKVSGGVSQFMEYARANGPLVRDTLANLGQALGNVLEAAANAGPGLLTVVNALAGLVASVPPGALTAMLQLALALKAVRLAAAAMAATSAGVTSFITVIGAMRTAAAGASGGLGRLTAAFGALSRGAKVAAIGTGVGLLLITLTELSKLGRQTPPDVDKLTTSLGRLGQSGKASGEGVRLFGKNLSGLYDAVRNISDPTTTDKIQQGLVKVFSLGLADSTPHTEAKEKLDAIDQALTNLVQGGKTDVAAAAFQRLAASYRKGGGDVGDLRSKLDGYKSALEDQKFEAQLAAQSMGLFGQQAQETSAKLAEQKQSADGLRQAIQALNDVQRAGLGGMIGFEAAIDNASKAARDNAGVLSMHNGQLTLNTDKQRTAAQALSDLAAKTDEAAAANRESTGSWAGSIGIYERGRQQLIKNAMAMGLTRDEAASLAAQILKTPNKTAMLKADITDWKTKISEAEKQLKTAKGDKKAKLTADIADWRAKVAQAELQLKGAKADKRAKLTADIADWKAKVAQADRQLRTAKGDKKAQLTANIKDWQSKISSAQRQINSLPRSRSVTLTTWKITKIRTDYVPSATKKGSLHDAVGATGGLYTGVDFKFRGKGYADGGKVNGPGTPTSDSVFAPWLSRDEFVVNAKQTAKHLPLLVAINNGTLNTGGLAGGSMAGAGADVASGLASGMTSSTSLVLAAARAMAAAVTVGVKEELQIASPSRKMKAVAKDVGKGFIAGLTASQAKIRSVSKDLANDVRNAFSGRKESALIGLINKDTKKLLSLAAQRDAIAKKIADANKFASDTASKARATGSLSTIISDDHFAPSYVKKRMQDSLASIKAFTANVLKLQKKGLNKNLLRQILEMGPEQGGAFAASLAGADSATIKQYNKLQSDIDKQSGKLGKVGADLLYDSGKKAGDGFLTGLKAQQKQIEQLMIDIAKGMQKALRKALGIKSPARKLIPDGVNTARGIAVGVVRGLPHIDSAMQRVASRVAHGARASAPAAAVGTMRKAPGGRPRETTPNVTVVVQNNGVLGSQRQVEDWLVKSLDNLSRTNRLPRGLRSAA